MFNQSSIPADWYEDQAALAAQELDFDLHVAAYEAETGDEQPTPDADTNSVYNLNALLDSV